MWQVLLYIQFIYQVSKAVLERGDKTDRNREKLKLDFLIVDRSMLKTELRWILEENKNNLWEYVLLNMFVVIV